VVMVFIQAITFNMTKGATERALRDMGYSQYMIESEQTLLLPQLVMSAFFGVCCSLCCCAGCVGALHKFKHKQIEVENMVIPAPTNMSVSYVGPTF